LSTRSAKFRALRLARIKVPGEHENPCDTPYRGRRGVHLDFAALICDMPCMNQPLGPVQE